MIKKITTGGTYSPNGFNITANLCCGEAVKPANCTKELVMPKPADQAFYKSIKVEGVEYSFPAPVDYTGLEVAIKNALATAGYTIDPLFSPIKVEVNVPTASDVRITTDKTNIDMLILRSVDFGDFPFSTVCPDVNLEDWAGNSTERVFLGFQNFTGDGSVVTLTAPTKANLAEINFLGGDGTYTLDGSDPTSSPTAQTGTDDVQFEVEEKTGIVAIKLSAPAGVTISVLYYYRPAGFNA